ncbi:MAG: molybdopterin molybdotransferase MoeA [Fuerstiella sp.]
MLTVEQALSEILNHASVGGKTSVPLAESLHRILAEDLITPHDSPPFDKSMMDGFAVLSSAAASEGPQTFNVESTITAGTVPTSEVTADTAARIMTGAPIPRGADCVVPIERTTFDESAPDTVTIEREAIRAEANILRQGSIVRQGEPLMQAGTKLAPAQIAVLAEFGIAQVPIYRQPTIAILATGDELLPIDAPLTPGRIRNSNEPMLAAQATNAGAIAAPLGVAKDSAEELADHIARGLQNDFLLLSGGVSAGTLDLVPSELQKAGVRQVFHKIQMKPGKPLWFGVFESDHHRCLVFGLPGNPVSSMICFELFVRSALRKFNGQPALPAEVQAELTTEVTIRGDRLTYFPARLEIQSTGLIATPVPWGGSADLRSTAQANGMLKLPPRNTPYAKNEPVSAIWW